MRRQSILVFVMAAGFCETAYSGMTITPTAYHVRGGYRIVTGDRSGYSDGYEYWNSVGPISGEVSGDGVYISTSASATSLELIVQSNPEEFYNGDMFKAEPTAVLEVTFSLTTTGGYLQVTYPMSGSGFWAKPKTSLYVDSRVNFVDGGSDALGAWFEPDPCQQFSLTVALSLPPASGSGQWIDASSPNTHIIAYPTFTEWDSIPAEALPRLAYSYRRQHVHNITQDTYLESIQAAIDDADEHDTIEVHPGTNYEKINFKNKSLTLSSTDPNDPDVVAATIINGRLPVAHGRLDQSNYRARALVRSDCSYPAVPIF